MFYDAAPSLRRYHPLLHRVYAAVVDMRKAFAKFRRDQQDHECLLLLPECQLRDIGLRRVAMGGVVRFIPIAYDRE
jgi:hypothetical protein